MAICSELCMGLNSSGDPDKVSSCWELVLGA